MPALAFLVLLPLSTSQEAGTTIRAGWRDGMLIIPLEKAELGTRSFLLDTGTDQAYLTPKGFARFQAAGGHLEADGTLTVEGLTLGGMPLPPINFAPEARAYAKNPVGNAADGYIGTDALRSFRLGLNLSKNEIGLFPSAADPKAVLERWFGKGGTVEATSLYRKGGGNQYALDVDVNGLTLPMLFDTGSPLTFVREDFMPFLDGATAAHGSEVKYYDGSLQFGQARVDWVSPSGTSTGDARRIGIIPLKLGYSGILGRDAITPYRVLLDYPAGKAYFAQTPGRVAKPRPTFDGPSATTGTGITRRWPRGVVAHVGKGWTFVCPSDYRKVSRPDGGVDLVPAYLTRR